MRQWTEEGGWYKYCVCMFPQSLIGLMCVKMHRVCVSTCNKRVLVLCILCRARVENDFGNGQRGQEGEAMDAAKIAIFHWKKKVAVVQVCTVPSC